MGLHVHTEMAMRYQSTSQPSASMQMGLEEHEHADLFRPKRVERKLARWPRAAPSV